MFNTAAGRHIMDRLEHAECEEISSTSSFRGVHQVTPDSSVVAALTSMANEIKELKLSAQWCEVCWGGHDTRDCPVNNPEHVSYADIAKSLKDRQGGQSSSSNASMMSVSVRSVEENKVVEDESHSSKYNIPSPEEVKKID
ncbi:hypothetical protein L1987_54763 [Smallanthus sonchifolius]|uniref:Uncharacterized protein n=1 Tax=Smallanthus sonchifolius TaxID=185202 RepID=A0ACB9E8E2_9ASTR|nr:hypothetical protein L1987_54763 [Smallanthus sonchifolius]